jgi:APA family basic amino acid/polyamine antiporter
MATANEATEAGERSSLPRRLGLATATALIVGNVIGVGIFLTPGEMAKSLGSPFWLLVVWLTMAVATIGGAFCYGSLAARYPEAGGTYVYLREIFGKRTAFLYGWLSMLVTDPGLTAMLAVGLADYAGHVVPLGPWGTKIVAAGSIIGLATVHMIGISPGSRVMGGLAALKLGLLGFLVLWGFGLGRGEWNNLAPFWSQRPGSDPLLPALGIALVGAFIAFAGWWDASKITGEVRDPKRTMPRALVLGVSIVTVVYVAVSLVFLYLVAPERIADEKGTAFAALAGDALFGRWGEVIFSLVVVISVAGSLAAILMAAPRVYFAMARDGVFFKSFGAVDSARDVPGRATLVQATLATALALSGSFGQILAYFMVPTLVFLALTVVGIFVLQKRQPNDRSLAPPGYPISPLLFLLPIVTVILLQTVRDVASSGWSMETARMLAAGTPWRDIVRRLLHVPPSVAGLMVVVLGIPMAGWVIPDRRRAAGSDSSDPATEMMNPDSTLDEKPPVPSIGTHS